jgi:signal transduction histidine kinase
VSPGTRHEMPLPTHQRDDALLEAPERTELPGRISASVTGPADPSRLASEPSPVSGRSLAYAWSLLSVLYALVLVVNGGWPLVPAGLVGALTISVALLLGVPVWHLTARLTIPDTVRPRFLLGHLAAAAAFSMAWLAIDMTAAAVLLPHDLHLRKLATMQWEMLLGVWVYGMIAGAAYTIRARRAAAVHRERSELAQARAVRAELDALRARLNPHFLFNALHALGGLARSDLRRFDTAVDHLGELLREAIRPHGPELVPLSDDLAFAQRYLEFERIRLGNRLHFEIDADDGALEVQVPFLVLQPIVENAVRHGIEAKPDGGTIQIRARLLGERLHIVVVDDGIGLGSESSVAGAGVGLGALRERLALLYRDSRLTVESPSGGGCVVNVRIPA